MSSLSATAALASSTAVRALADPFLLPAWRGRAARNGSTDTVIFLDVPGGTGEVDMMVKIFTEHGIKVSADDVFPSKSNVRLVTPDGLIPGPTSPLLPCIDYASLLVECHITDIAYSVYASARHGFEILPADINSLRSTVLGSKLLSRHFLTVERQIRHGKLDPTLRRDLAAMVQPASIVSRCGKVFRPDSGRNGRQPGVVMGDMASPHDGVGHKRTRTRSSESERSAPQTGSSSTSSSRVRSTAKKPRLLIEVPRFREASPAGTDRSTLTVPPTPQSPVHLDSLVPETDQYMEPQEVGTIREEMIHLGPLMLGLEGDQVAELAGGLMRAYQPMRQVDVTDVWMLERRDFELDDALDLPIPYADIINIPEEAERDVNNSQLGEIKSELRVDDPDLPVPAADDVPILPVAPIRDMLPLFELPLAVEEDVEMHDEEYNPYDEELDPVPQYVQHEGIDHYDDSSNADDGERGGEWEDSDGSEVESDGADDLEPPTYNARALEDGIIIAGADPDDEEES